MQDDRPILALDTGSPVVSVALGRPGGLSTVRTLELRRSSEQLLTVIDEVLTAEDLQAEDLRGIASLRGPGSFTGLRVGLGTALGLHQALGLPAVGPSTLAALALAATTQGAAGTEVTAAVDAMRGEWCVQSFALDGAALTALDTPHLVTGDALAAGPRPVVGFALEKLGDDGNAPRIEPPPLAPFAVALAAASSWDPGTLIEPIYFRPPAVTPSKKDPPPRP
ncbi:MAG: tRNA (adenosine(37)-N6)-threonylcarbamoyltransferase complex dimerization subunit type 1 TsaB [Acidobacteriota bacterium]